MIYNEEKKALIRTKSIYMLKIASKNTKTMITCHIKKAEQRHEGYFTKIQIKLQDTKTAMQELKNAAVGNRFDTVKEKAC